jgi:hypothetical protein
MDVNGTSNANGAHSFLTKAQQAALDAALEKKEKAASMFPSPLHENLAPRAVVDVGRDITAKIPCMRYPCLS